MAWETGSQGQTSTSSTRAAAQAASATMVPARDFFFFLGGGMPLRCADCLRDAGGICVIQVPPLHMGGQAAACCKSNNIMGV